MAVSRVALAERPAFAKDGRSLSNEVVHRSDGQVERLAFAKGGPNSIAETQRLDDVLEELLASGRVDWSMMVANLRGAEYAENLCRDQNVLFLCYLIAFWYLCSVL